MHIEAKLRERGFILPQALQAPPELRLPYANVRIYGQRVYIAGHAPLNPDGTFAGPFGQVDTEVSLEQAYHAARLTALAILGDLQRALGDLDRVRGWLRVFGMVNSAPGFAAQPNVINGFSDLILELYGPEVGQHARSAVGLAALPAHIPVEIEAEVAID